MADKEPFDLWWEWAEKPHESLLMIDADIHRPIMELSPKSEVQYLSRIGRRVIVCMLLIAALAVWS